MLFEAINSIKKIFESDKEKIETTKEIKRKKKKTIMILCVAGVILVFSIFLDVNQVDNAIQKSLEIFQTIENAEQDNEKENLQKN